MIRTIKVDLNAAYPNMPLEPVNVFAGSAASFTICNVPRAVGDRSITNVSIEFKTRGGMTNTLAAVRVGSAWEVTIPASSMPLPYSASLGVKVVGIGLDENKSAATWVLGVADLNVLNNQGQITPGADAGDIKHSEFADLDPDTSSLSDVITRLKGSAMSVFLLLTISIFSLSSFASLPVTPVYTNHNRVAGNVQTMTNMQAWASAVESAIDQGGGGISTQQATNIAASVVTNDVAPWAMAGHDEPQGGIDTNAVKALIESETRGTNTLLHTDVASDTYRHKTDMNVYASNVVSSALWSGTKSSTSYAFNNGWTEDGKVPVPVYTNGSWSDFEVYEYNGPIGMAGREVVAHWGTFGCPGTGDETDLYLFFVDEYTGHSYSADVLLIRKDVKTGEKIAKTSITNGLITASTATNAAEAVMRPVSNRVDYLDGYIAGQRVRVSVTNYYGNTSGELPRLRIEEFVTATNVVDGVETETNYWQIVWDEQNKYDRFMSEAKTAISSMTNSLYQTYYALLQERLATKAPRAWGTLTSAGEAAPPGSVWHTEPNTVFAGGTEYAHAMVGTGVIGVLSSKGAAVYTDGETGRFHFTTDDKTAYFGMNIASRYELGCATDGITVTPVGGNNMVDLLYNVTMSGKPVLYYTPTLQGNVTWEQITDSSGGSIPGATVYASWDQSPPAGSEICTINCGASLSGFFKASVEYAGVSKFETNMMADLAGGIVATNVTNGQSQPIEAIITNGIPVWRVKQ